MQAVFGELIGGDIIPNVPRGDGVDQDLPQYLAQLALSVVMSPLVAVHQGGQLRVPMTSGSVRDKGVRVEDGRQTIERVRGALARVRQFLQVVVDLALMPRLKDGLHVGEVLVEGCPSDPRLLCDLRHRHRAEALLGNEPCC